MHFRALREASRKWQQRRSQARKRLTLVLPKWTLITLVYIALMAWRNISALVDRTLYARAIPRAQRELRRILCVNWSRVMREALADNVYSIEGVHGAEIKVISLLRSRNKRYQTIHSLREQGLSYKIVDAVDGLSSFPDDLLTVYAGKKKRQRLQVTDAMGYEARSQLYNDYVMSTIKIPHKLQLSLHERMRFGCYISHALLWQEMVRKNIPFSVIMEDDVVVERNFTKELNRRLKNLPDKWGVLYLNGCHQKIGQIFRPGLRLSHGGLCTFAYVISANAARSFLQRGALKSDKPIDHMMDEEILSGRILAFHSDPPLVSLVPHVQSTLAYRL